MGLMLCTSILDLGQYVRGAGGRRASRLAQSIPLAIGVASIAGLPPTLGFAARWLLYADVLDSSPAVLTGVVLVLVLSLPPTVNLLRRGGSLDRPGPVTAWMWLLTLALPTYLLSLAPTLLVRAGFPAGGIWDQALAASQASYSLWAMLLVPAGVGTLLLLRWSQLSRAMRVLGEKTAQPLREMRGMCLVSSIGRSAVEIVGILASLGGGRHGAIWLTLYGLGIVLLIFIM